VRRRPRVCATTAKLKAHGQGSDVSTSAVQERTKKNDPNKKAQWERKKSMNKSIVSSKKENLLVELGN